MDKRRPAGGDLPRGPVRRAPFLRGRRVVTMPKRALVRVWMSRLVKQSPHCSNGQDMSLEGLGSVWIDREGPEQLLDRNLDRILWSNSCANELGRLSHGHKTRRSTCWRNLKQIGPSLHALPLQFKIWSRN